jgi:hypothetical protein
LDYHNGRRLGFREGVPEGASGDPRLGSGSCRRRAIGMHAKAIGLIFRRHDGLIFRRHDGPEDRNDHK